MTINSIQTETEKVSRRSSIGKSDFWQKSRLQTPNKLQTYSVRLESKNLSLQTTRYFIVKDGNLRLFRRGPIFSKHFLPYDTKPLSVVAKTILRKYKIYFRHHVVYHTYTSRFFLIFEYILGQGWTNLSVCIFLELSHSRFPPTNSLLVLEDEEPDARRGRRSQRFCTLRSWHVTRNF